MAMAIITALIMIIIMAMKTKKAAAAAATRRLSAIFCYVLYSAATGKRKNEGEGGVSEAGGAVKSSTSCARVLT